MFMAKQKRREEEPTAELGAVTISGSPWAVALAGERRETILCSPGGYHWMPRRGDTILVMKSGAEQMPCAVGTAEELDSSLEPGEVWISAAEGTGIHLKTDGSIELVGQVSINGTHWEG